MNRAALAATAVAALNAAVLGASRLAGTVFGVSFHSAADTVDHVSHRTPAGSGTLFVASAIRIVT